jgi:hypothetical protein
MRSALTVQIAALDMCALILKVQEGPQFEAGI